MRLVRLLPLLFLLDACIDPLDITLPIPVGSLVVDGMITDQPGPYTVKLQYSGKPDTVTLRSPRYETGASVWIIDDEGTSELLTEMVTGVYQSSPTGIRGQTGRSYRLRVVTSQNVEYQSTSQILSPSGQIDKLYVEYHKKGVILNGLVADAFSVLIDATGPEQGPFLFRWRWSGNYKAETFPQLRVDYGLGGPVPDPEPCSGYIVDVLGTGIKKIAECTCCICWTTEYNSNATVSSKPYVPVQEFKHVEVARLAITPMRFYEKYYVEVEQLSTSQEDHEFWKLIQAQQHANGSLFQPNSIKVRGNIRCITDPGKEALGIFSVSGSTKKTLFINRADVALPIPPLNVVPMNCMEGLLGGGTTQQPPFW